MTGYVMIDMALIEREFPLLSDYGLDENEHHIELLLLHERKRLHALLAAAPKQAAPVAWLVSGGLSGKKHVFANLENAIISSHQDEGAEISTLYAGHPPAQPAPIPTIERLPSEADGDWMGCVLVYADDADWQLWEWSRVEVRYFSHWLPTGLTRPAAPDSVYGHCPTCGAPGITRERRPNGNDKCANGHTYPSSTAAHGGE